MTTVSDTGESWLKQRTSLFSSTNSSPESRSKTSAKPVKTVDKELARLKNMGAVSSVWSNKFVKEDNPGVNTSPRPNADYIPVIGHRQTFSSFSQVSPTSPRSDTFPTARARTLSGNTSKMADDINTALQNNDKEKPDADYSFGYFFKNSVSSFDLNENNNDTSNRSSSGSLCWPRSPSEADTFTSLLQRVPSVRDIEQAENVASSPEPESYLSTCNSISSATETDCFVSSTTSLSSSNNSVTSPVESVISESIYSNVTNALKSVSSIRRVNSSVTPVDTVPSSSEIEVNNDTTKSESTVREMENANLWFHNETLKTQNAQSAARLQKANEETEFYKRQLENLAAARKAEITGNNVKIEQLHEMENANLWFHNETLKTQNAQSVARLNKANEEAEFYKRQLENLATARKAEVTGNNDKLEQLHEVENASLWFHNETLKTQNAQSAARLQKAKEETEFYKRQLENLAASRKMESPGNKDDSMDQLREVETASLWFHNETLKTQNAQSAARLQKAKEEAEFYKRQLENLAARKAEISDSANKKMEELRQVENANLWFHNETLKSQNAQSAARLQKSKEETEFYKRQLTQLDENSKKKLALLLDEKDVEVSRIRQLVELIVRQDQLLLEYETKLEHLIKLTDEATYIQETQEEMNVLRQELEDLYQTKMSMDADIKSLRGELEMSHGQMRLMMAVSTEIQNEFEAFKEKIDFQIKNMIGKTIVDSIPEKKEAAVRQIIQPENSNKKAVDDLQNEVADLKKLLAEKDKKIMQVEFELKSQKITMEAQMMRLNQSILEKDGLLLEFMSARNYSTDSHILESMPAPPSTIDTNLTATDLYYNYRTSSEFQPMSDTRRYISAYRNEESDGFIMSYSSDDDAADNQEICQGYSQYVHQSDNLNKTDTLGSPADSVSTAHSSLSSGTFEENRRAEIKHFSYSSAQSQPRPLSLMSGSQMTAIRTSDTGSVTSPKDSSNGWPMPPPTPPPSDPLPPVPALLIDNKVMAQQQGLCPSNSSAKRTRSRTLVTSEHNSPNENSPQKNITAHTARQNHPVDSINDSRKHHTKWMDDPESEDDNWAESTVEKRRHNVI
ncbi:hypothetical protein BDB01DRAFT_312197 [Pilobolus umbonatus]|nr:hypothetical protein BDB01DRAFT_312197 [Pilobolus umbonatus]